ncbi:MAG: hypothetical protein HY707_13040 [Ignavibacteriae bacterium]|nr:hypothetical protein [Ignavibacteriota bacterium]
MIETRLNNFSHPRPLMDLEKRKETIFLYSPDIDFCVSLRMLFEDRYHIVTTTDPSMLLTMVRTLQPDLVIADALPTERMQQRFAVMKRENPLLRIMVFSVSSYDDMQIPESVRNCIDVVFSKPVDLVEVTRSINDLVSHEIR